MRFISFGMHTKHWSLRIMRTAVLSFFVNFRSKFLTTTRDLPFKRLHASRNVVFNFYETCCTSMFNFSVDTLFIFSTGINNQKTIKRVPYKNASKTVHSTTSTVTYLSKGKPTGVPLRCMSLNRIFSKLCVYYIC